MPHSRSDQGRDALLLLLLVAVRTLLGAGRLWADPARYRDWEDAYNATVSWYLLHGGLFPEVLRLQHLEFCGGCTVVAIAGAPVLGVLGDHWLAWRAVALVWGGLTVVAGWLAARRWGGPAAGWAAAVLLAMPPAAALEVSLMTWGNHTESVLVVLLALAAAGAGQAGRTGLLAGLAVWFCRGTLGPVMVVVGAVAVGVRRDRRALLRLGMGLLLGLGPVLLPASAGQRGTYDLTLGGMLAQVPAALTSAPQRLATAITPGGLSVRAFGPGGGATLPAGLLLVLAAASLLLLLTSLRDRPRLAVFVLVPLAWLLTLAVSTVDLPAVGTDVSVRNVRYFAPWAAWLALLVAGGAAAAWREGRAGRVAAVAAVGVLAVVQVVSVARLAVGRHPGFSDLGPAADHARFSQWAGPRIDDALLDGEGACDPVARAGLRMVAGVRLSERWREGSLPWDEAVDLATDEPVQVGLGLGVAQRPMSWSASWTSELNASLNALDEAQARWVGRGMALGLAVDAPPGVRDFSLLMAGNDPDAPCRLCAARGVAVVRACRHAPEPTGCIVADLAGDTEAAWGAGVALAAPGDERLDPNRLDPPLREAFLEGAGSVWPRLVSPLGSGG